MTPETVLAAVELAEQTVQDLCRQQRSTFAHHRMSTLDALDACMEVFFWLRQELGACDVFADESEGLGA